MSDEEKLMVLAGAIGGAWMAYQSGADPAKSLKAIWDTLQRLLEQQPGDTPR